MSLTQRLEEKSVRDATFNDSIATQSSNRTVAQKKCIIYFIIVFKTFLTLRYISKRLLHLLWLLDTITTLHYHSDCKVCKTWRAGTSWPLDSTFWKASILQDGPKVSYFGDACCSASKCTQRYRSPLISEIALP